jgi:streptogramin lyase
MQKILYTLMLLLSFHVWKLGAQTLDDRWTSYLAPGLVNDYLEEADKLYVATDAGVFVMDKATRTVLEHWTKRSVGIPSNRVESIRRDAATNRIFIGTYDIAALTVQNTDGSWENIPYPEALTVNNSANPVMTYCLEFDDENRAWIGTSHGLLRYDANLGENAWTLFNEANTGDFFRSVWDMAKTPDGRLLFGSHLLFGSDDDGIELLSPLGPNNNPFSGLFSYSDAKVHVQADGTIWFFTDVGSYGRYDGNEWEVITHTDQPEITFHSLDFLTEDATGALWANLGWQGFVRYNSEHSEWEVANPVAGSQMENPSGLYFSDNGPVLFEQGKIEWHDEAGAVLETTNLGNYPFNGIIWNMEADQEGSLWCIEANQPGRLRNLESGDFIDVAINGEPVYVGDFAFTNEGKLWVISGKRVIRQTENGWEFFDYTNSELPDSYGFSQMTIDSEGRAWIAVYEKGLYRYDSANGWKRFNHPAILQNFIIDLEAGQNGQLWISTWYNNLGTRLLLLDGENLSIFNPELGSNYWSLNKLEFDEQTGRLYGAGSGLGYWQNNAWHPIELPVDLGNNQYLFKVEIAGNYIFAATRESIMLFDGNEWEVFTPENSPLQHHNFYDSGLDALSGRIWVTYSSIRAVDVYQTDFAVSTATPGNHLNSFKVTLSPNPATDLAAVEYELPVASAAPVTGRIYNLQGALLRSFEWDGSAGKYRQELDLSGLEAGVYLMEIVAGKQRKSVKIVKY